MDEMRKPFFLVALVLLLAVVGLELGSALLLRPVGAPASTLRALLLEEDLEPGEIVDALDALAEGADSDDPPGLAIPMLAVVDGMVLVSMLGLASALVVPHRVQGRLVAPVTLVCALLVLIAGIVVIALTMVLLLVMVGLFLSPPFGTLAYLARWGFFRRGEAQGLLAVLWLLKLGFIGFALAASPRLLVQKGLVALVATGVVLQLVVGFLHGAVPLALVSITDAVGAIVVGIVGVVWAVVILVGSVVGTVRILRVTRG